MPPTGYEAIHIRTPNRKRTSSMLAENKAVNHNRNKNVNENHEIALQRVERSLLRATKTVLVIKVSTAVEIDRETKDPLGDPRIYRVHGWVLRKDDERASFHTPPSWTLPNPEWSEEYYIHSGLFNSDQSLHLELYRMGSKSDPGPSTGEVLVGRARIPLPKELHHKESRRHGLVKPGGSPDGFVFVSLMLFRQKEFEAKIYWLNNSLKA